MHVSEAENIEMKNIPCLNSLFCILKLHQSLECSLQCCRVYRNRWSVRSSFEMWGLYLCWTIDCISPPHPTRLYKYSLKYCYVGCVDWDNPKGWDLPDARWDGWAGGIILGRQRIPGSSVTINHRHKPVISYAQDLFYEMLMFRIELSYKNITQWELDYRRRSRAHLCSCSLFFFLSIYF